MFMNRRINSVPERDRAELDALLENVTRSFDESWLAAPGGHPLQVLWRRPDAYATTELLTLGHALGRMAKWPRWLTGQVAKAKSSDINNRRGALFEILALGQLEGPNFAIEPAPDNHPGHDAFVRFSCGAEIGLSLKSYEISVHQREFEEHAAEAWERFTAHLEHARRNAVELYIFCRPDHQPRSGDWKALRALIARGSEMFEGVPLELRADPWELFFRPMLPEPGKRLAQDYLSARILVCVPRHVNDERNLLSKLEDARANLERHAKSDPSASNYVLIKVPSDSSVAACEEWAKAYLAEHPSSPIASVALYQVEVAHNEADGTELAPIRWTGG